MSRDYAKYLRCANAPMSERNGKCNADCPYFTKEEVSDKLPCQPDLIENGKSYWTGCDIERMEADIADYLEKYRWHDLRKNPDDLPVEEGEYIVCLEVQEMIRREGLPEWRGGIWNDDEWIESEVKEHEITTRSFCQTGDGWEMCDWDGKRTLWWSEETGSSAHERVIAWKMIESFERREHESM